MLLISWFRGPRSGSAVEHDPIEAHLLGSGKECRAAVRYMIAELLDAGRAPRAALDDVSAA